MFLPRLRTTEKLAFLQLANHLIQCDGTRSESEEQLFEAMTHEMQFAFEPAELAVGLEQAAAQFESPAARRIALVELISLGYADQEFSPSERAVIGRIAAAFGVETAEVERLDEWVRQMVSLVAAGERLLV